MLIEFYVSLHVHAENKLESACSQKPHTALIGYMLNHRLYTHMQVKVTYCQSSEGIVHVFKDGVGKCTILIVDDV